MNMKQIALLAIWWAIGISPAFSSQDDIFIDATFEEIRNLAGKEGKLFLVHFRAAWCMPCQWMEENTFTDGAVKGYLQQNYLAIKVDIDEQAGQDLQKRFEVRALPTVLFFNTQGQLLDRMDIALEPLPFKKHLEKFNQPRHRIGQNYASTGPILASPVARLPVYRPPLTPHPPLSSGGQTDQELVADAAGYSTSLILNHPQTAAPETVLPETGSPVQTAFIPRSEKLYAIQLGVYTDYQNALRTVTRFENRFKDQEVQMIAFRQDGHLAYRILIGKFGRLSLAEEYLLYLNRNDIRGVIRSLGD